MLVTQLHYKNDKVIYSNMLLTLQARRIGLEGRSSKPATGGPNCLNNTTCQSHLVSKADVEVLIGKLKAGHKFEGVTITTQYALS
jgi:hypothetical protein